MDRQLGPDNVIAYLAERGVVGASTTATAREFGGGVSGVTLLVEAGRRRLVVKQALSRLRVQREWYSDPRRAVVEARALEAYADITPEAVPELVDVDPDLCAFTMSAAPAASQNWREQLLSGQADARVAAEVGTILGRWHAATVEQRGRFDFSDRTWFHELRVTPFYRAVMAARPDLADAVHDLLQRMLDRQQVLVHGDFSPKNVLVLPGGGVWVLDFEVAHRGDPTFDLAFLVHHLLLKAVHLPQRSAALLDCAESALTAYHDVPGSAEIEPRYLVGQVGCLALARVLGTSPAPYLRPAERARVERLGARLVEHPPAALDEAWPGDESVE